MSTPKPIPRLLKTRTILAADASPTILATDQLIVDQSTAGSITLAAASTFTIGQVIYVLNETGAPLPVPSVTGGSGDSVVIIGSTLASNDHWYTIVVTGFHTFLAIRTA